MLAEDRLDFKKALEISLVLEAATKDTKQLQTATVASSNTDPVPVYKVREIEKPSPAVKCFRCGKPNHKALECHFKESVCTKCKKKGHLAKVCHSSGTPQNTSGHFSQTRSPPAQTNTITPSTQLPEEYQLFSIQQASTDSHTKPLTVPVTINGKSVSMEIDTGSAVSFISDSVFNALFDSILQETEAKLCTYSGEQLPVKGKIPCEVNYKGQTYSLPLTVLAGGDPTRLGINFSDQNCKR